MSAALLDARLAAIEAMVDHLAPRFEGRTRGGPAEAAVEALERSEGVRLPEEYRALLLRVGDGAPGLLPLERWGDALMDGAPLRDPCPLDPRKGFDDYGDDEPAQGTLALTAGNPRAVLVVSGERRGQVLYFDIDSYWSEVVEDTRGEPVGLLDWYEALLEGGASTRMAEGLLGSESALIAALRPTVADPRRRAKAAVGLGERGSLSAQAFGVLEEACEDPSPRVRLSALRALHRHESQHLLPRLVAASADPAPEVRREVVHLVRSLPAAPRLDRLRRLVDDDDDQVVFRALAALLHAGPSPDELALLVALPSVRRVPDARGLLLHALGESSDPRWLPELLGWLEHEQACTRLVAVVALGKLGSPAACGPLLARRAHEPDARVQAALGRVLEALGCLSPKPSPSPPGSM